MKTIKVYAVYASFAVLFAVVFALMLALLTAAVIGIPSGVMVSFFGVVILLFKADFIICFLPAPVMIFGGLAAAFFAGLCGLVAVKMGFFVSHVFVKARSFCDRLRGW